MLWKTAFKIKMMCPVAIENNMLKSKTCTDNVGLIVLNPISGCHNGHFE